MNPAVTTNSSSAQTEHYTPATNCPTDKTDGSNANEEMVYTDPMAVPKTFVELINSICFKLHEFTTMDLLVYGIRFITILLFASILLPYNLFHILLFILIIVLSIIYVVGKNAFRADKANAPVDKQRLAAFRTRLAAPDGMSRLRRRRSTASAATTASSSTVNSPTPQQ